MSLRCRPDTLPTPHFSAGVHGLGDTHEFHPSAWQPAAVLSHEAEETPEGARVISSDSEGSLPRRMGSEDSSPLLSPGGDRGFLHQEPEELLEEEEDSEGEADIDEDSIVVPRALNDISAPNFDNLAEQSGESSALTQSRIEAIDSIDSEEEVEEEEGEITPPHEEQSFEEEGADAASVEEAVVDTEAEEEEAEPRPAADEGLVALDEVAESDGLPSARASPSDLDEEYRAAVRLLGPAAAAGSLDLDSIEAEAKDEPETETALVAPRSALERVEMLATASDVITDSDDDASGDESQTDGLLSRRPHTMYP